MMLPLDLVKAHCRIEPDFTDDDTLLVAYVGAALRYVENYTHRTLFESAEDEGYATSESALLYDDDIKTAMLLMVGHWYGNREATVVGVSASKLPLSVDSLLKPYRIFGL